MSTFFQLCDRLGQAEVARRIGVRKNAVNRAYRGLRGVDDKLIALCAAAPGLCDEGETFDVQGTLLEWYQRLTVDSPKASNTRAHTQAAGGGHAA